MSIIRNRLYQFKQELLSNKDRAWYSHTNLLTAVDLLIPVWIQPKRKQKDIQNRRGQAALRRTHREENIC